MGKPQTTPQVEESLSSRWFFFFPTAGTLSSVVKRCSDCCVSPLNIRFAEAPARAIRRDDHLIVIGYGRQRSEAQFPELLTLFGAFKNPETSFSGRFMARCSVPGTGMSCTVQQRQPKSYSSLSLVSQRAANRIEFSTVSNQTVGSPSFFKKISIAQTNVSLRQYVVNRVQNLTHRCR